MGLVASWHLRQPSHINQWCCSYCVSLAGALAIIFMMVTATTFFSFRNFGKLYKPKIPFFWWWSLFHYIQSWLNQPPHQSFPRAGPRPTSQPRRAGAVWKHHPPSFPQRVFTFKFSLSLSMSEDNKAGEDEHGGPMSDHQVDMLGPPALSCFPSPGLPVPGPAPFSLIMFLIWFNFSDLPRQTVGRFGFNNMADRQKQAQRAYFWQPSPFNHNKGWVEKSLGCKTLSRGVWDETCQRPKSEKGKDMRLAIQKSKPWVTEQTKQCQYAVPTSPSASSPPIMLAWMPCH